MKLHLNLRLLALVLVVGLLCSLLSGCNREPASSTVTIYAMDTVMQLTVLDESEADARDALNKISALIQDTDRQLDIHKEGSELAPLGDSDGSPAELSPDTVALLQEALDLCAVTEGALDITASPAMEAWGFPTGEYRVPDEEELARLAERIDYQQVSLTDSTCTLPAGMGLDLGGVAKGWTADLLAEKLPELGISSALLDLGQSTIYAPGTRADGGPWRVGIQDPLGDSYFAVLEISGHMSTSGMNQRYFDQNGQRYWHILDPATAAPARSGLASVTVTGPSGLLCDGLSTALFVMGAEKGAEFWRSHPDLGFEAIFVAEDGSVSITKGLEDAFSLADGESGREVTVLS